MVGVVDATTFDQEKETFAVVVEYSDGELGHLGKGGLLSFLIFEVGGELHVGFFEKAEEVFGFVGIDFIECTQIVDEGGVSARIEPLVGEISDPRPPPMATSGPSTCG